MRIRFELTPLSEIRPWGEPPKLHWFGLTDGWYCLDLPGLELLRYTEETVAAAGLAHPWVDYYVARIWEDFLVALPAMLAPVPADAVALLATGSARWTEVDEQELDDSVLDDSVLDDSVLDAVFAMYDSRCVDTLYLRHGPEIRCWRTIDPVDVVTVAWRFSVDPTGEIAFTAPTTGSIVVPTEEFRTSIIDFDREFISAMSMRVDELVSAGPPSFIDLNISELIREHEYRATRLAEALRRPVETDWDAVRGAMSSLLPRVS